MLAMRFLLCFVAISVQATVGLNSVSIASDIPYTPRVSKVLVTGAAGRTGKLVFEALLGDNRFDPIALVRTEQSARKLMKSVNCLERVVVCDITDLGENTIPEGLEGTDSMIICTSAVPKISKASLIKAFLKIPVNMILGKKMLDFRSLKFKWRTNGTPEKVDYEGQIAQIDLAKKLGIQQVVIVSSMGGTDPSNFLNAVGKNPDGTGNGDILLWKRKAERYLVESGLSYSIIHPGGLIDTDPGIEQIILDVDDRLMANKKRSISRGDVASICLAALSVGKGKKVSFDCITRPVEESGAPVSAEDVLAEFLKTERTANYSL